jgi:NhaP-type Na+/H+ or K+/H+ antiporter
MAYCIKMSISERKRILVLQWCSFMLTMITLAYCILHTIQWDEGEIREILQNIILKSAVCIIIFFALIFQGFALMYVTVKKSHKNDIHEEYVENPF